MTSSQITGKKLTNLLKKLDREPQKQEWDELNVHRSSLVNLLMPVMDMDKKRATYRVNMMVDAVVRLIEGPSEEEKPNGTA